MPIDLLLSLTSVIVIVIGLVLLRSKTGAKYEVKVLDVVIGLVPVGVWLLASGKLVEFGVGDFKLKLQEITKKPVAAQITKLKEQQSAISVGVDCKYGLEDQIIKSETFPEYVQFKYIIIEESCEDNKRGESSPKFYALLSVEDYKQAFLAKSSKTDGDDFLRLVKSRKIDEFARGHIPSFIGRENAVKSETQKIEAIKLLDRLNVEALPVVDGAGAYIGVVTRARLATSLLIDIAEVAK